MQQKYLLIATLCLAAPCGAQRSGTPVAPPSNKAAPSGAAAALRVDAQRYRSSHEATILQEFSDLLALPNVASDHPNIRRNADMLVMMLRKRGVEARTLELEGASPAVYGMLTVPGATRTVILYAHNDGQPVTASQWATPPWSPTLRDKPLAEGGKTIAFPRDNTARVSGEARIYARSSGDDKASIVAMLTALDALHASGRKPSVNIKFLFEGEEEAGSPHLLAILQRYHDLLTGDVLLLCDGPEHQSGRQQLLFGVRGTASMELTVYGATAALHSGHYGNWAPNPGAMLSNLIASMRDDDGRIKIAGFYADVAPVSRAEQAAIRAVPPIDSTLRRSLGLARTEANNAPLAERLMAPALNVRGLSYGSVGEHAANVISTEARASFDFRLVPHETPEHVRELVDAHIRKQGYFVTSDSVTTAMRLAHPRIARVVWAPGGYPANRTAMDSPVARAVIDVATDSTGKPPVVLPTMGASAPSYMFTQALHVPVIIVPIANYDDNQHAANENLRVQNLWDGIELYAEIMGRIGTVAWR
jgi:acetylornithine deacetylase/succinyl-diaminopimelate desuccinylase-like protein